MSLALVLDHRADVDPERDAVSDGSQSLTNAQLLDRARGAARHLKDLGVRSGDVIALKLTNRVEFVVVLFAGWRLGAAITPMNPSLTDVEVDRQLDDSRARFLVAEDGATTMSTRPRSPSAISTKHSAGPDPTEPPVSSALALLIYTSGTTGVSKGLMLDHANLDAMFAGLVISHSA